MPRRFSRAAVAALCRFCIVSLAVLMGCSAPVHEFVRVASSVHVTGIRLNQTTISLVQGHDFQLTATVSPPSASNKTVLWSSQPEGLVAVSSKGLVTAVGSSGQATVKATTVDGQFVATCQVTLNATPVFLDNVAIAETSLSLQTGTTSLPLTLAFNPPNATDIDFGTIVWSASNGLVTINPATGAVTAGNTPTAGGVTVKVNVKNTDGAPFESPAIPVTITTSATPVNNITAISPNSPTLHVGDQLQLTASVNSDASEQRVDWEVAAGGGGTVVHIDADGLLHADSVGTAMVRARAHGDPTFSTTTQVTVAAILISTIDFNPGSVTVPIGGSKALNAIILPDEASNKTLNWTSSDATHKITVDSAGVVSVAAGAPTSAVITADATDGSDVEATCIVVVGNPVTAITANPLGLGLNETGTLSATTTPPGGSVVWIEIIGTAATVTNSTTGTVTAGGAVGTLMVKAQSLDGTVSSAPVTVTVYDLNSSSQAVIPMIGGGEITQGNTLNNSGATMAVDPADGTVYIAYVDSNHVGYVQKAQGQAAWQPVGGNFADDGMNNPPLPVEVDSFNNTLNISLAVDQGIPYIADSEGGGNFDFPIVRRFVGGSWTRVGTNPISVTGAGYYLSLGFDDAHNPFLGFSNQGASVNGKISVVSLNGGVWGAIGGNSVEFSNAGSIFPVVAYDFSHSLHPDGATIPSRNYYVAFEDHSTRALVVNFPVSLPASPFVTVPNITTMMYPDMTIQNGKLYLSYRQDSNGHPMLYTQQGATTEEHDMDNTTTNAQFTSVSVDPRNGTAYVVYANTSGFLRISKLDANASSNAPGTVIVSLNDFVVNTLKSAFYVDSSGQGHLYVCYGLSGAGGVLVKDFKR